MKYIAIILASLLGILTILWLVIGGPVLVIVLSVSSIMLLIISSFSAGIWFSHKSIQLGAQLVTEAQNNNDKWDATKMGNLVKFGQEMMKLKGGANEYPLLEDGALDGNFTISGIDDDN